MKILVGVSGGIDSTATLIRLHEEGHELIGVTLKLNPNLDEQGKCCSFEDLNDIRLLCTQMNIRHYIVNVKEFFEEKVIKKFIQSYLIGETPNPCIDCNSQVRFQYFFMLIQKLNCDFFATGHYAILEHTKNNLHLKQALDKVKDQSYFLSQIPKNILKYCLFPLGETQKKDNIELLEKKNIAIFKKKESYDICFVPGKNYSNFLKQQKYLPIEQKEGFILNQKGEQLGNHKGLMHYTIGQRKGLNLNNLSKAAYVQKIDTINHTLVVGETPPQENTAFIKNLNIFQDIEFNSRFYDFQIRLRSKTVKGILKKISNDYYQIHFDNNINCITPGQTAVAYLNNEVIFSGKIFNP